MLPRVKAIPIAPADAPASRTRYTRRIASNALQKTFAVAVVRAMRDVRLCSRSDRLELREGQSVDGIGEWHGEQAKRASDVGRHEQPPLTHEPIDQRAGGEADEQEGPELRSAEEPDLKRRLLQRPSVAIRGSSSIVTASLSDAERRRAPEPRKVSMPLEMKAESLVHAPMNIVTTVTR